MSKNSYNVDYDLGTMPKQNIKVYAFFSFRAACFSKDAEWANNPAMWRVDQSMPQIQSATKKEIELYFTKVRQKRFTFFYLISCKAEAYFTHHRFDTTLKGRGPTNVRKSIVSDIFRTFKYPVI